MALARVGMPGMAMLRSFESRLANSWTLWAFLHRRPGYGNAPGSWHCATACYEGTIRAAAPIRLGLGGGNLIFVFVQCPNQPRFDCPGAPAQQHKHFDTIAQRHSGHERRLDRQRRARADSDSWSYAYVTDFTSTGRPVWGRGLNSAIFTGVTPLRTACGGGGGHARAHQRQFEKRQVRPPPLR